MLQETAFHKRFVFSVSVCSIHAAADILHITDTMLRFKQTPMLKTNLLVLTGDSPRNGAYFA